MNESENGEVGHACARDLHLRSPTIAQLSQSGASHRRNAILHLAHRLGPVSGLKRALNALNKWQT